ncbi:hypothetical protein I6I41_00645 [Bacillus cereus]|uniref:hypothetical protein n=1 Tax=Bacillus cereus TaxID=1396 RepID=UPI00191E5345|nr:hypothetical protein [Bacillus cereus]QQU31680.1 hypothetical protein I6I41_00645 [Bacillus cereus]
MKYEVTVKEACTTGFWSCLGPTDWISLISVLISLAVCIAGWRAAKASKESSEIAKKQLEEMVKQRSDSVRPELSFKDEKYVLRFEEGMISGKFNNMDNPLDLNVTNVGNGHAKKVKMKWDFDTLSSGIDFIKNNQEENQYILDYKEGSHITLNGSGGIYLDTDLEGFEPIFITNTNYNITLPLSYTKILSIIIHLFITKHLSTDVIPKLKLSISYYDVLNTPTPITKEFLITPKVYIKHHSHNFGAISYETNVVMQIDEVS